MSAGGDATRGDNTSGEGDVDRRRGIKIGDELLESEGTGEGRRWGVGDIGDGGITLGGGGGVIIMGEECGLLSFSSSARASSSYRRAGMYVQFIARGKPEKKPCITFCTRSATSCTKASLRAADCCSTRIAPSDESCGKGGSTKGIVAGIEPQ